MPRILLILLACTLLPAAASAQVAFPSRPVRMIVGFPPGGSSDVSARLVAERMAAEWKQPVLVENRPGAGGTLAAAQVAAAPADGYTLLHVGPGTHAISAAMYRNLPYDAIKSFTGVGQIAVSPFVMVTSSQSTLRAMKDLLDYARANPGKVSYGSSGSGAGPHLVTEIFAAATGVKLLHVPYKGAAPAAAAALAGQVEFATVDSASAIPHVQAGRLRALAVTTAARSPLYAGVPTVSEAGAPGFAYPSAVGFLAPAGTPREVVLKINASLNAALANEAVRTRLSSLGFEATPMSADEFSDVVAEDVRRYGKVVRDLGLKLD